MSLTDTNANTGPITGRCVCGDLTYRLDATPLFTHAWLSLPDDVPQFEFQYDQEKVWPAESLTRLKALRQTM